MTKVLSARSAAASVVARVMGRGQSLAAVDMPVVRQSEQALVQEIVLGTLRNGFWLREKLSPLLKYPLHKQDPRLLAVVLIGCYQLELMRVPAHAAVTETVDACDSMRLNAKQRRAVNGLLRAYARLCADSPATENKFYDRHCLPAWLYKRLHRQWPQYTNLIASVARSKPPLTLRINRRCSDRIRYAKALQSLQIKYRLSDKSDQGIHIDDSKFPVRQLPGYAEGLFSVQDEHAQLAVPLLSPASGQRILDACAAPGGKTSQILECCEPAQLMVVDHSAQRLERVAENLRRLNLQNKAVEMVAADVGDTGHWWDGTGFDRILLDVPCSATGILRRHPDILYLRQERDINTYAIKQLSMLHALWRCLNTNGMMLYVSCSLLKDENEYCIERFLSQEPTAKLVPTTLPENGFGLENGMQTVFPEQGGGDGFFLHIS